MPLISPSSMRHVGVASVSMELSLRQPMDPVMQTKMLQTKVLQTKRYLSNMVLVTSAVHYYMHTLLCRQL